MLIGDGPDRSRLMQRARELDVLHSICPVGTHAEFVDYLRHAEVFLLPSQSESFGVAALEALACGVPVAAYRVGGLPEVVSPDAGRLVEPFDVDALAAATVDLLADPGLRDAMGLAARRRAMTLFPREAAVGRYEEHYRRVLGGVPREDA
jgi:glycosyltransferase involved in cell wall biosynthesis